MKKTLLSLLFAVGVAVAAQAASTYDNVAYVNIVSNAAIGVNSSGTSATVSNATGVAVYQYPGTAALVLSANCGDSGNGVIAASVWTAANAGTAGAYTNGTWSTSSNSITSYTWTNTSTRVIIPWTPNHELGYVQVRFTATSVTNGNVSALLVAVKK